MSFLWFAVGLSLTLGGALVVARSAARLSDAIGLSPFIRGLVLLALATSLPELAIAKWATHQAIDLPDLALGNIIGSVIANYLLALAFAAIALPLVIPSRLLRFAFPLAIVASLAAIATAWTGAIVPAIGGCLLLTAVVWPIAALAFERRATASPRSTRKEKEKAKRPSEKAPALPSRSWRTVAVGCTWFVAGIVAVTVGARLFLAAAPKFAGLWGLDDSTFGLTVVALATTMPEAALCLVLTLRGDRESAAAIAVGSSLFNLTAVLGVATLGSDNGLAVPPVIFELALPFAIAAGLACVPSFYGMRHLSRLSGLALFAFYVAFVAYALVGEDAFPTESDERAQQVRFYAMFLLAIGLIVVTSIVAIAERLVQKARLADE